MPIVSVRELKLDTSNLSTTHWHLHAFAKSQAKGRSQLGRSMKQPPPQWYPRTPESHLRGMSREKKFQYPDYFWPIFCLSYPNKLGNLTNPAFLPELYGITLKNLKKSPKNQYVFKMVSTSIVYFKILLNLIFVESFLSPH